MKTAVTVEELFKAKERTLALELLTPDLDLKRPIRSATPSSPGLLLAGFTGLWGVNRLYRAVRGHDGIGAGDFKLLAGLGALLGWKLLPAIVLLSSVVGAVVGIALIGARRLGWTKPIPFGPYLAGGGLAAAFFGGPLTALYFPGG